MKFDLDVIVSWAKRKGFVYPGSDIYGGLANAWDLGPYGVEIKNNIEKIWWDFFVKERQDMVGLDAQILMNPQVWVASGHVGGFSDPLIDCKACGNRFRADKMIEDVLEKMRNKGMSEDEIVADLKEKVGAENVIPDSWEFEQQEAFFEKYGINCETCGKHDWTNVRHFNLMFKTQQGVTQDSSADIYMRPETAQGIFVNFKNVIDTMRVRVPFGIAQIGKSFRNEITPGNFLFRLREFYQMEIEYFVENDKEKAMEHLRYWKDESYKFWKDKMGVSEDNMRFRQHEGDELSHYSDDTYDIEYKFKWGWGELQGIAYRTDFDLKAHQEHSKKDMQYNDPKTGARYVPHVIEPSFGLTRAILIAMLDAYDEETYADANGREQTRVVLRFHKDVAPIKFAILPLVEKNEEIVELSNKIFNNLKSDYTCELDSRGNIGKRYRRQDEIGTPYCITVDYQSLEDGTVTLRDRDTMEQTRVKIEDIKF